MVQKDANVEKHVKRQTFLSTENEEKLHKRCKKNHENVVKKNPQQDVNVKYVKAWKISKYLNTKYYKTDTNKHKICK